MGVSLVPIGNHKIKFKHRRRKSIAAEILSKLNSSPILNKIELDKTLETYFGTELKNKRKKTKDLIDEWKVFALDDDDSSKGERRIKFSNKSGFYLTFGNYRIIFWQPPYRYSQWIDFEMKQQRNEWRKYFKQIVTLFGGDRVIYMADSGHPLCRYDYAFEPGITFEEIETLIKNDLGEPKKTFAEVAADYRGSYFIDFFDENKNLKKIKNRR